MVLYPHLVLPIRTSNVPWESARKSLHGQRHQSSPALFPHIQGVRSLFNATLVSNYPYKARHALHPTQAIQTPQQFHDWFALIERSIQHSQEAHFRAHLSLVSKHLNKCDELLADVDGMDNELRGMLAAWKGVEEGGRSLKGASEQLLREKAGLWFVNQGLVLISGLESVTRSHRSDQCPLGVLPGARARHSYAQSPRRGLSPSAGFPADGRAGGCLS